MKSSKKMILVPETEYLTLLQMLNIDPLVSEKAQLENKMHNILRNPKISEDIKMQKHNLLSKQIRQLKQKIDDKPPQKVIVQDTYTTPNVAPYLGITPSIKPSVSYGLAYQSKPKVRNVKVPTKEFGSQFESPGDIWKETVSEIPSETLKVNLKKRKASESGAFQDVVKSVHINKKYIPDLIEHIDSNREKFGVNEDGSIRTGSTRSQGNFEDVIKYMGDPKSIDAPAGTHLLYQKLRNDPFFESIYSKSFEEGYQKGSGKVIKKVRGLRRIKITKFKPQMWTRL
jgi:hypothetical protein